jgi:DNA adenine methylase
LHARGLLTHRGATLTDDNADLIACYRAVRDCPEQVIGELLRLASGHARGGTSHYYEVRNERFNPQRATLAASNGTWHYDAALAAMFIYLNRTGYNGLFRLNGDGEFNVPAGRYANPRICDAENVRRVAQAFAGPGVTVERTRFDRTVDSAAAGDFLYFDPPYAPLSRTARFTSYTTEGFVALARRGCHVVLSNSTAPEIAELYEGSKDVMAAGLWCYRIQARRAINSNAALRGVVDEYVITNTRPSASVSPIGRAR